MIYRNDYILIKKVHFFVGKHEQKIICRGCLSSYSNQNVLMKIKQRCEQHKITGSKTSYNSQINWAKSFQNIPLSIRTFANLEADNEHDNSNVGNADHLSQAHSVKKN